MSRETLREFWQARTPRERAFIAAAAFVLGAGAIHGFLIEPGMKARQRLSAALPHLRAQLEDMRQQKDEIAALRRRLAASAPPADLPEFLRVSVARSDFAGAVQTLEFPSAAQARLVAAPVPFDAWLDWLETLQREFGIRVERCRILAAERPGLVRVEATLSTPPSAGQR